MLNRHVFHDDQSNRFVIETAIRMIYLSTFILMTCTAEAAQIKIENKNGRVVAIYGLSTNEGCFPFKIIGNVTKQQVDKNHSLITGVYLKEKREEYFVNGNDPYEFPDNLIREKVKSGLNNLLKVGNKVEISAAACGAAGRIIKLESVKAR